jgi:hypothetical protein
MQARRLRHLSGRDAAGLASLTADSRGLASIGATTPPDISIGGASLHVLGSPLTTGPY